MEALGKYRDSFAYLEQMGKNHQNHPENGKHGKKVTELMLMKRILLQNMSICTNATGFVKESIENLNKAIEMEKTAKGLYLRSVAYMKDELF